MLKYNYGSQETRAYVDDCTHRKMYIVVQLLLLHRTCTDNVVRKTIERLLL